MVALDVGGDDVEIPDELFELKLGTLYVDGNKLQTISSKIGNLENLLYLSFNNNNNISTVPDEIGNLKLLKELDLRNVYNISLLIN